LLVRFNNPEIPIAVRKPGIGLERVQALADVSCSALCCHSNETRAPIANPPNSAQLRAPVPFLQDTSGFSSSVGMRRGTERHTHTHVTNINFASATPHAKCNDAKVIGATSSEGFLVDLSI